MATSVETRLDRVEDRLAEVVELLNGGANVSWDRSVRGRLHFLMAQERARELLLAEGTRRFTRAEKMGALLVAVVALAAQIATLLILVTSGGT
jgi:hypothetical protein